MEFKTDYKTFGNERRDFLPAIGFLYWISASPVEGRPVNFIEKMQNDMIEPLKAIAYHGTIVSVLALGAFYLYRHLV